MFDGCIPRMEQSARGGGRAASERRQWRRGHAAAAGLGFALRVGGLPSYRRELKEGEDEREGRMEEETTERDGVTSGDARSELLPRAEGRRGVPVVLVLRPRMHRSP